MSSTTPVVSGSSSRLATTVGWPRPAVLAMLSRNRRFAVTTHRSSAGPMELALSGCPEASAHGSGARCRTVPTPEERRRRRAHRARLLGAQQGAVGELASAPDRGEGVHLGMGQRRALQRIRPTRRVVGAVAALRDALPADVGDDRPDRQTAGGKRLVRQLEGTPSRRLELVPCRLEACPPGRPWGRSWSNGRWRRRHQRPGGRGEPVARDDVGQPPGSPNSRPYRLARAAASNRSGGRLVRSADLAAKKSSKPAGLMISIMRAGTCRRSTSRAARRAAW